MQVDRYSQSQHAAISVFSYQVNLPEEMPLICCAEETPLSGGQEVQTDPSVLRNLSLVTVGHPVIMPTHRLNDTDSLQQMLSFHSLNPQLATQEQPANPSIQTPGGEESARKQIWGGASGTHFENEQSLKRTLRKDSTFHWDGPKYVKVKCQISSLFRLVPELIMLQESEWLFEGRKKLLCCAPLTFTTKIHFFEGLFWTLET